MQASKAWWNALNRARAKGNYDRVVQLYAVPVKDRPNWTSK